MQRTVSDPYQKPASDQVVLSMQPPPAESAKPRPILTRLPVSKPKSRYIEHTYSPRLLPASEPEPEPEPDSDSDQSDFDEEAHPISGKFRPKHRRPIGPRAAIESIALISLTTLLAATLTIPYLKAREIQGLKLWEWAVMLLVVFCGRLIANWLVWISVFFIEKNFPLKERVLYFVYGLRRSVRSCVWLVQVLLVWFLLFDIRRRHRVENSSAIRRISLGLVAVLIAATIWMLKILLVKVFASSFHVVTFFDRMKESVFHHYILETLSDDPIGEYGEESVECRVDRRVGRRVAREKTMPARAASRRIDIEGLRRLSTARATTRTLKKLVSHVMSTGLSTVSRTVDRVGQQFGEAEAEITSEWEARCTAEWIFKHVARPGNK